MTSNYNIIYTGKKTKYKEGDVFLYSGEDWRLQIFDGLKIQSVTFNFGDVLHFDITQWNNKRNNFTPPTTPGQPLNPPTDWLKSLPFDENGNVELTAKMVDGQLVISPPTNPATPTNP
jgi:hypothetical protein